MTTGKVSYCLGSMVAFYPKSDTNWQLIEVAVKTYQKNVRFISGYLGGNSPEESANDFTAMVDTDEMMAKCWTNEDKTVLKAVAVFSKHKAPFEVVVKMKNTPPIDNDLTQKYLKLLDEENGLQRAYSLLTQSPKEYPMVPVAEMIQRFRYSATGSENGLVNLRQEIIYRWEMLSHSSESY